MSRLALPNRRPSLSIAFRHGSIDFHGTVSYGAGGYITEVFLSGGKPGSEVEAAARDCAVIASLAIQHGAPLETIRKALTRLDDGSAAGPLGALLDIIHRNIPE